MYFSGMYIMKGKGEGLLNKHSLRNEEDFMHIYHAYNKTVFGIAFNYTRSNSDANDILQDVFLKYFISKKAFNSDEHIKAWLIRVTINACKKYLRYSISEISSILEVKEGAIKVRLMRARNQLKDKLKEAWLDE